MVSKNILRLLVVLFIASGIAFAQGGTIQLPSIVLTGSGQPVAGATITACATTAMGIPCTPSVPIYQDIGLTMPYPGKTTVTDGLGNVKGYLPSGDYIITVTGARIRGASYTINVGGAGGCSPCVTSLNTFTGAITIVGGTNVTVSNNNNVITINSTGSGSGTVAVCGSQYALGEYLTAGSVISCGPIPPTVDGIYYVTYSPTASAAVAPSINLGALTPRGVTGATSSDTILYTDAFQAVEYQGSASVATSLPTPTSLLNPNFGTYLDNLTTGTFTNVTITPAGGWTINGGSTYSMKQNQGCQIQVNPSVSMDWLATCVLLTTNGLKRTCIAGLGDGLNAIPSGTYLQFNCVNTTGQTLMIAGISCWTDNAGSSTLNAANNAATALLTGAVTCNNTKANGGNSGTQSATTTIASGDAISFTFVADGTTKQTTWTVALTQ